MDFGVVDWFKGQKDSDRTFMIALVLFGLYYFGKKQKEKKEEAEAAEAPDLSQEFAPYPQDYNPDVSVGFTGESPQYTAPPQYSPPPPTYTPPTFTPNSGGQNGGNRPGFARGSGYNQAR